MSLTGGLTVRGGLGYVEFTHCSSFIFWLCIDIGLMGTLISP